MTEQAVESVVSEVVEEVVEAVVKMTQSEFNDKYSNYLTIVAEEAMQVAAEINKVIEDGFLCVAKQFVDGFFLELQKK
jgi:predicted oxidoreductase (fatty acid repression mutant protein)